MYYRFYHINLAELAELALVRFDREIEALENFLHPWPK